MADVAFAISLHDEVSAGAKSASASLGQTEAALRRTSAAGGSASNAMARTGTSGRSAAGGVRAAGAAGDGAAKGLTRTAKAAEDAAKSMERAAAAGSKAGSKLSAAGAKGGGGAAGFGGLDKIVKGLFPQLGGATEQAANLSAGLGGLSAASAGAALAVAAVGAATIAATAAFLSFGISAADSAQHLRAMSIAQTGSVAAGTELAATIGQVSGRLSVGSDELSGYAGELRAAGIAGQEMRAALEAAGGSSKLFGSSAGGAFVKTAIEAKKAGKSVAALAAETKAKLGKGLELELARPTVAMGRLRDSLSGLFDTADVSGFGNAINQVSDALAAGAAVGDAWRAVFSSLFGALGMDAQSAAGLVVAVLEEITIVALRVAIAVKPLARAMSELWTTMAQSESAGAIATGVGWALVAVFAAFAIVGGLCAAALTVVVVGIAGMIVAAGVLIGVMVALPVAVIGGLIAVGQAIVDMATEGVAALGQLASGALTSAQDFIAGLVNGISAGAAQVVAAARNLGAQALAGFKGVLGIASPSKVMAQMGGFTAEGFAGGMDAGAAVVEASASSLAAAPIAAAQAAPPAALPAARGGGSSGGGSIDIGGVQITINGVAGAEAILEKLPAALADAFEQIAESMGIAPAEA